MTVRGVTIGDKFKMGGRSTNIYEVVDFYTVKSATTGEEIRIECIAKGINTIATNKFEVAFATVIRHKL